MHVRTKVAALGIFAAIALLAAAPVPRHSHYLFAWAMEVRHPDTTVYRASGMGRDFLAVFDVSPSADPFGRLVAMLPVGHGAMMAHHTNYALPPNDVLLANDWMGDSTYMFDLHDATKPRLVGAFGNVGPYEYPHTFVYLGNGDTLATFQYTRGFNRAPGGIVELDAHGRPLKMSSAADAHVDPNIRPYSIAVVASENRVVTTSADMMGAQSSHVVQIWRLSDLRLLKTIVLPNPKTWFPGEAADSSEPRVLADGKTVMVPTFSCGLYLVHNLAGDDPTLQLVYDFGYRVCEVPVVVGDYLVETMESGHAVVSLDVSDPEHPRQVSEIQLKRNYYPHWIALEPGGDRLVITGYGAMQTHMLFATIDRATGRLTLDPESIDFTRVWPDGWHGSAIPHGTVFSND